MAGNGFHVTSGEVSTGTAKKTVLQVKAASNIRLKINEFDISFKGTSNTAAPIRVQVSRQSTDGTAGSAVTPVKNPSDSDDTLQLTAGKNYSAEPTEGDILFDQEVHPQTGYTWQAPFGAEIMVKGGDRLAIVVTAGADVTCTARFRGEE